MTGEYPRSPMELQQGFSVRNLLSSMLGIAVGAALVQLVGIHAVVLLVPLLCTHPLVCLWRSSVHWKITAAVCFFAGYLPFALSFGLPALKIMGVSSISGWECYINCIGKLTELHRDTFSHELRKYYLFVGDYILEFTWTVSPFVIVIGPFCLLSKRPWVQESGSLSVGMVFVSASYVPALCGFAALHIGYVVWLASIGVIYLMTGSSKLWLTITMHILVYLALLHAWCI